MPPDYDVEHWPKDLIAGKDPQLEKAIELALEALEEEPAEEGQAAGLPEPGEAVSRNDRGGRRNCDRLSERLRYVEVAQVAPNGLAGVCRPFPGPGVETSSGTGRPDR